MTKTRAQDKPFDLIIERRPENASFITVDLEIYQGEERDKYTSQKFIGAFKTNTEATEWAADILVVYRDMPHSDAIRLAELANHHGIHHSPVVITEEHHFVLLARAAVAAEMMAEAEA